MWNAGGGGCDGAREAAAVAAPAAGLCGAAAHDLAAPLDAGAGSAQQGAPHLLRTDQLFTCLMDDDDYLRTAVNAL